MGLYVNMFKLYPDRLFYTLAIIKLANFKSFVEMNNIGSGRKGVYKHLDGDVKVFKPDKYIFDFHFKNISFFLGFLRLNTNNLFQY